MSAGLASKAVQAAIYAALAGDTTLKGLTGASPDDSTKARVYDEPPEGAAFPYVVVGNVDEAPNNRMGAKVGREVVTQIDAWAEDRGTKTLQQILGRVDALLDNNLALAVTGYTLESIDFESGLMERVDVIASPLRHGQNRYRVRVVE